jgi:hypothetical protein
MPHHTTPGFCSIEEALEELRAGRMIVLVDDEHRENEGDVVMAAETITPQAVNFIIRHACGRLCVPMSKSVADQLGLELLPGLELDPRSFLRGVVGLYSRAKDMTHDVSGCRECPDNRSDCPRRRRHR